MNNKIIINSICTPITWILGYSISYSRTINVVYTQLVVYVFCLLVLAADCSTHSLFGSTGPTLSGLSFFMALLVEASSLYRLDLLVPQLSVCCLLKPTPLHFIDEVIS